MFSFFVRDKKNFPLHLLLLVPCSAPKKKRKTRSDNSTAGVDRGQRHHHSAVLFPCFFSSVPSPRRDRRHHLNKKFPNQLLLDLLVERGLAVRGEPRAGQGHVGGLGELGHVGELGLDLKEGRERKRERETKERERKKPRVRRAYAVFLKTEKGFKMEKMKKKVLSRTSLKGSKTIPESLSAAPAALVTVAEELLLSLRRGGGERRGPTMPATMVVVVREEEVEEEGVERLMFFFFFFEFLSFFFLRESL